MGTGTNSSFWFDPWLDGGPLFRRYARLFTLSMDKLGTIADVVSQTSGVLRWNRRWQRVLFEWEVEQLKDLQQKIVNATLKWEGVDRWVWKKDPSGAYTVRSAYKWIRNSDLSAKEAFHDVLWSCGASLKIKAFVWKLVQDRIPTSQNLIRRGIRVQNGLCKGCNREVETADHLFFRCELFLAVWYECLRWWGIQAPLSGDYELLFFQFLGLLTGSKTQLEMWSLVWFAIIWVIWNHCNGLLFKDRKVDIGEMVEQIKLKTWMWITAKSSKFGYPVSLWFANPRGCVGIYDGDVNGEF